jgi:deoxycytidine triphosphate deaminase
MAFWSSQRIKAEQFWTATQSLPQTNPFTAERRTRGPNPLLLISGDYKEEQVKHGAYELKLDTNVLITPDGSECGVPTSSTQAIKIPPGQFALLFTKETVNVPSNVIAFISLKGNIKFKGLINISGFQVNPGFSGHLKFSVYNASGDDIHLNFDEPCFQIWFAELDAETEDPYGAETGGHYQNQKKFTPDDRDRMAEERHSPENLHNRLIQTEKKIGMITAVGIVVVFPAAIGFATQIFDRWFKGTPDKNSTGEIIIWTAVIVGLCVLGLNSLLNGSWKKFVEKCERDTKYRE